MRWGLAKMAWVPSGGIMAAHWTTAAPASDIQAIPMAHIEEVDLDKRARRLDMDAVARLKESIRAMGLQTPIGVRAGHGTRGAPFRLIYGLHRFVAYSQLADEGLLVTNIPAVIYPADMPDWQIELRELSENLHRLDLSGSERAEHGLRYAALLKENKLVQSGDEASGARRNKVASTDVDVSKPTTSQAVGALLGKPSGNTPAEQRHNASARANGAVNRALKNAGLPSVSLDKDDAKKLRGAAEALATKHDEVSHRHTRARKAAVEARPQRPPAIPPRPTEATAEVKKTPERELTPNDFWRMRCALDQWEQEFGTGGVHAVVERWWQNRYPPGRVVWMKGEQQ